MSARKLIALTALLLGLCSCSVQRALTVDRSEALNVDEIETKYQPAGTVVSQTYKCSVPGPDKRKMLLYLPEGYYSSRERYPVLYLIHGARGNETSWIKDGNLIAIVDSLTDANEAVSCIIVMPNMNQYDDNEDFGDSRFKRAIESFFETDGTVEAGFTDDVVSTVDSLYRTIPDKAHRAIAGLSVGALQSIFISARNPEDYDYVGMFSPLYKAPPRHGKYAWYYGDLAKNQVLQFEEPPKLYLIEIGRTDFFHPHINNYRNYLTRNGYEFQYFEAQGGHNWDNWQLFFTNFMKQVFK